MRETEEDGWREVADRAAIGTAAEAVIDQLEKDGNAASRELLETLVAFGLKVLEIARRDARGTDV